MKKKRKIRDKKWQKTIKDLVPLMFALGICSMGIRITGETLGKSFGEEIRQRLLEFKLMGVIEVEKINKNSKVIEYHRLKGIKNYIKNFLKRNPKWKSEEEDCFGVKTGRIILTRVYRTYNKKRDYEDNYCSECGRSYDYDD